MSRPTAATTAVTVGTALRMMRAGRFRVPAFQRPFVWGRDQTISFFESIVAGLPTGAITALEDAAGAAEVRIGPFRVWAPADPAALWIVDGLQRLGTLAGTLLGQPSPFRLAYDLSSDRIREHDYGTEAPPHLLPLDVLADPADFAKWLGERDFDYAERAVEVSDRILDYPLVLVRYAGVPKDSMAEAFVRLNSGTALSRADLNNARNPAPALPSGADTRSVSDRLASLGFGRVPPEVVLDSVRSVLGPEAADLTEPDIPPTASLDAERALSLTISWLRDEAAIPHLVVWDRHVDLLPVLARFFHLNDRPSARARVLLRRWLWRVMGEEHDTASVTPWPISGGDSADVSALLARVSPRRPGKSYLPSIGETLALTTLEPISLATGRRLTVPKVLEAHGSNSFRPIGGDVPVLSPPDEGPLLDLIREALDRPDVLVTHALDREMVTVLFEDETSEFRKRRHDLLAESLLGVAQSLAEWEVSDRPAIADLLVRDDEASGSDDHAY